MKRQIQVLSGILVIQLGLAAVLSFTGTDSGAFTSKEKYVGLTLSDIDKITIEEQEKPLLVLNRQDDDDWMMPGYFDFPVDTKQLNDMADTLFNINKTWPIATTGAAEKRFKVGKEKFERRIVFSKADKPLDTLYIGSSPSYKKVHARLNDEDEIYSIDFSAFKASSEGKEWADKDFLQIPRDDITDIVLPTVQLKREGTKLIVADLKETETSNETEISNLTNKISNLTFSEVLGKEAKPEFQQDDPKLELELTVKSGKSVKYALSKFKEKNDYVLKKSTDDYYFKIVSYVGDELIGFSRDNLVKEKEKDEEAAEPKK